ncbi:MAG: MurR/RpiR family transcriptional regulator [Lachnospiraceae bacterium]|nr:MurR/RpiR family transcriptional regulator [Lachnospiraceae bacterium]
MDFYESSSNKMEQLSRTEQEIVHYIYKNMSQVKNMSIRELAENCFVSSTTIFRFVKKLGYDGYADFIQSLSYMAHNTSTIQIPKILHVDTYRDDYLNNVVEAVKVVTDDKMYRFNRIMSRRPKIYMVSEGLTREAAHYIYHILTVLEFEVYFLQEDYEIQNMLQRITSEDVLFVLSYTGNNMRLVHIIEKVLMSATPTVMSITRSDNNSIQNMSNLNFYVFADEVQYKGFDLTSRCGMIAIFETLIYRYIVNMEKDA